MTEPVVDGRTARRDRNRELVLDAVLELFAEGTLLPTAPQVAERSGVSLRSVFRYYEDTESLARAAMARHLERVGHLFPVADLDGLPFDERVRRFVASRLDLYEAVAPMARAALLRQGTSPVVAERLAEARRQGREVLEATFAPELDALPRGRRREVLDAADVAFQLESLEHLVVTLGRDRAETERVLRTTLTALLAPG